MEKRTRGGHWPKLYWAEKDGEREFRDKLRGQIDTDAYAAYDVLQRVTRSRPNLRAACRDRPFRAPPSLQVDPSFLPPSPHMASPPSSSTSTWRSSRPPIW